MAKVQFTKRQETSQIFVHCSATKATMDIGVREIRQWHKEQGWLDVGYHFIIRRIQLDFCRRVSCWRYRR